MMLAVATTLGTVLLPGAFAIPDATAMHRALQSAKDAHASGSVLPATASAGLAAELAAATTVDANGGHHLWFRSTDPALGWCGEIDAAPYMPAEIFQPQHFLSLLAYAHVTTSLYSYPDYPDGTPSRATPLVAGRCSGIDYNRYGGVLTGISWFGADGLMGPVCAERCGCNFEGQSNLHLPACEDGPDDPSTGSFCSLCGPTTGCPGCGTVDGTPNVAGPVYLFKEGAAECLPRGCACQTRPPLGPKPVYWMASALCLSQRPDGH